MPRLGQRFASGGMGCDGRRGRPVTSGMADSEFVFDALPPSSAVSAGHGRLRMFAIGSGLACAVLFVAVGVGFGLQMYADGSIFSYAVAVQDVWAFHWHNIAVRLIVFLVSMWPAELFVELTGAARGGIIFYGLLFFSAQLVGLALTYALDRSRSRIMFVFACASIACLCPLVFGFPTEMWMAHAAFWPTLAAAHDPRRGAGRLAVIVLLFSALMLTHPGAVIFGIAIIVTLALRGFRDAAFLRGIAAFLAAMAVWLIVKYALPPGAYFASIMDRAALDFIDVPSLVGPLLLLLVASLAGYGVIFASLRNVRLSDAHVYAAALIAAGLAVYWLGFDHSLHAAGRYQWRTVLLIGVPIFGGFAAAYALAAAGQLKLPIPLLPQVMRALASDTAAKFLTGALTLVLLVNAVETAKFVAAWSGYKAAVRTLAMGEASDPQLGDARFVSSARIPADLNRLSWFSTTQYLGVLLAPGFAPRRLVVDPHNAYFWLSCGLATASAKADQAIPTASRELIRLYSCQHRK